MIQRRIKGWQVRGKGQASAPGEVQALANKSTDLNAMLCCATCWVRRVAQAEKIALQQRGVGRMDGWE